MHRFDRDRVRRIWAADRIRHSRGCHGEKVPPFSIRAMISLGVDLMTTRIVRVGNTLTVEIPAELVAEASLPVGEPVEWVSNGDGTISLVSPDSAEHIRIRAGLAELEAGKGVSNERVMDWLDSWGTENEPPAPQ